MKEATSMEYNLKEMKELTNKLGAPIRRRPLQAVYLQVTLLWLQLLAQSDAVKLNYEQALGQDETKRKEMSGIGASPSSISQQDSALLGGEKRDKFRA